ncbi:exported hypothetical protein [Candidatus Sulfopaludibacter sp. SbA4]|nr:exported hypothetical protein [Candidatus Sulfopaludibacter sp. SbA4]
MRCRTAASRAPILGIFLLHSSLQAQTCNPPLCVSSTADSAANPATGTLRYAVLNSSGGNTITFAPSLNGQTIALDTSSPNNHLFIFHDLTIQGPGAGLLTISGGSGTRISFIAGGNVTISDLTLANGLAQGGNGGAGAGGGGGAAGMGGAIFVNGGNVTVRNVTLAGNTARGGAGGAGSTARRVAEEEEALVAPEVPRPASPHQAVRVAAAIWVQPTRVAPEQLKSPQDALHSRAASAISALEVAAVPPARASRSLTRTLPSTRFASPATAAAASSAVEVAAAATALVAGATAAAADLAGDSVASATMRLQCPVAAVAAAPASAEPSSLQRVTS